MNAAQNTYSKKITWRELSITKAKPNFESLILMDHFGGKNIKKSLKVKEKQEMILQQKQDH